MTIFLTPGEWSFSLRQNVCCFLERMKYSSARKRIAPRASVRVRGDAGRTRGGKRLIRRSLTWDERLVVVQWYLSRCGIREYEQTGDTSARDKAIIFLLGEGQTKESIAAAFGLTTAGVSRVVNRLKREHGVDAENQAAKSRGRNSGRQVAP